MKQHLAGDNSNDAKSKRIDELQGLGLSPLFEELETVKGTMTDARQRESYWIRFQGGAGAPLLNTGFPLDGYERTKRGYALRDDLVKACKQIALDRDITLYEVMETAIGEYLERQKGEQTPVAQPSPVEQKQKPRAEVEAPVPLPDDLVTLQAFADQHFVNRNEAERLRQTGAIAAVKGNWIVGKQRVTIALDAKGRRDFWVQFHETQGFRACDDCPHT